MTEIASIHAREILDSRGNPTVEADVVLDGGIRAVPQFQAAHPPASMRPWSARRRQVALPRQGRAAAVEILKACLLRS